MFIRFDVIQRSQFIAVGTERSETVAMLHACKACPRALSLARYCSKGRIQESALGGPSPSVFPSPSLPLFSLLSPPFPPPPLLSCSLHFPENSLPSRPIPSHPILSPYGPSLPLPLEVGPLFCGQGFWRSAQAPPAAGPGGARPPNGFW